MKKQQFRMTYFESQIEAADFIAIFIFGVARPSMSSYHLEKK